MAKYIIELERGETAYKTVNSNGKPMIQLLAPTLYTEPDLEQVRDEAYEDGYKTAKVQCDIQAEKDMREVGGRHYQRGLSDAWEAARKICLNECDGGMSATEVNNIFKVGFYRDALLRYSAAEAIEKIRQYEQGKKEEWDGLRQNIQTIVDQCGYTLDEIAEVLQKMREDAPT